MWSSCQLRINGQTYLPDIQYSDHWTYQRIMCLYTERERQALFHSYGKKKKKEKGHNHYVVRST